MSTIKVWYENNRSQSEVVKYQKFDQDKLIGSIVNYKLREPLSNVYSYIELSVRDSKYVNDSDILASLTKFSIEEGFKSWDEYLDSFIKVGAVLKNDVSDKSSNSIELKLEKLSESLMSVSRKMLVKFSLFIFTVIFNGVMYLIISRTAGQSIFIGDMTNSTDFDLAKTIFPITAIVNILVIIIIILTDFSIIGKFKEAGEAVKYNRYK